METNVLISLGIVATGLIIFLFLSLIAVKKHQAIKHYEKIRDKLTLREEKEEEVTDPDERFSSLPRIFASFISAILTLFVGGAVISEMSKVVDEQCVINTTMNSTISNPDLLCSPILNVKHIFILAFSILFITQIWSLIQYIFKKHESPLDE